MLEEFRTCRPEILAPDLPEIMKILGQMSDGEYKFVLKFCIVLVCVRDCMSRIKKLIFSHHARVKPTCRKIRKNYLKMKKLIIIPAGF